MNILITGGGGYIGSVATRILKRAGHSIIVLDNFTNGHRDAVPSNVRIIEGDVGDFSSLISKSDNIDLVIHLAALISVEESMKSPELYWDNNVVQTIEMLKAMRLLGINKLIFASTAAVYGDPNKIPITEDAPKTPTNTYGMTKLAMDMAISSEAAAYGLAAMSVRFFNVAGAYEDAGERHTSESHLIPIAFDAASGVRDSLTLFGTNYETPDGTCIRDYIHVADLVDAMALGIAKLTPGEHLIYNLGNGSGFSNYDVLRVVEAVSGQRVPVIKSEPRAGDPAVLIASSDKAKKELGWKPSRPNLEQIISDAWLLRSEKTD